MPVKEILRGIVFLHRKIDDKDFNEVINCIPDSRMDDLEQGLKKRQAEGEIDSVQIARHRKEAHPLSIEGDQIDKFFQKIDSKRLHSSTERVTPSEGEDDGSIPSGATT